MLDLQSEASSGGKGRVRLRGRSSIQFSIMSLASKNKINA